MRTFKFVHIDDVYRQLTPQQIIAEVMAREKHLLCHMKHADALPHDIVDRMRTMPSNNRVVILSAKVQGSVCLHKIPSYSLFPFCFLHKNGINVSYAPLHETLRPGNYFLAEKFEFEPITDQPEAENFRVSDLTEYRYHVDVNEVYRWRNDPPYVNLDRDSDSIGHSSWDGNLVSWFRSSFQSRLLYAVHSGLLPETD